MYTYTYWITWSPTPKHSPHYSKITSFVSFSTSRILKLQVPRPWASLNVIKRTPHRFGRTKVETAESIWPKYCHQPKNLDFLEIRGLPLPQLHVGVRLCEVAIIWLKLWGSGLLSALSAGKKLHSSFFLDGSQGKLKLDSRCCQFPNWENHRCPGNIW